MESIARRRFLKFIAASPLLAGCCLPVVRKNCRSNGGFRRELTSGQLNATLLPFRTKKPSHPYVLHA